MQRLRKGSLLRGTVRLDWLEKNKQWLSVSVCLSVITTITLKNSLAIKMVKTKINLIIHSEPSFHQFPLQRKQN